MNAIKKLFLAFALLIFFSNSAHSYRRKDFMEHCPLVKPIRSFQLDKMMGFWFIVEYYSSSEMTSEYKCMQGELKITDAKEIIMNFTYSYVYDLDDELLSGNITWRIPNYHDPSHWIHTEEVYEGVYNTYVIDSDYDNWALIMHCAEKKKSSRHLSAFMLSRTEFLGHNVKAFLREKLPQYNIDLDYMFEVRHDECKSGITSMKEYYEYVLKNKASGEIDDA